MANKPVPEDYNALKTLCATQQVQLEQQRLHIARLEAHITVLQATIADQQKTIDQLRQQNQDLQNQLQRFMRQRFGRKSERGKPSQFSAVDANLLTALPQTIPAPAFSTHVAKQRTCRQFPNDLPRKRIEYDLLESQKYCDCGCGCALKKIGEDILEQLEIIPTQVYVVEHVRFKYAGCAYDSKVVTATMPRQPIDKAMAGAGLLADVLVKKYDDHLPLYRQSEILTRHGIDLPRSTLCDWVGNCAQNLSPLVDDMRKTLLASPKIHTDDTTVPVQEPGLEKTKTGRLWIYYGYGKGSPPCAIYDYTPTRQRVGPMTFLQGYRGYLQADAYAGYDALYGDAVKEVACMAHVRRKFYDVAQSAPTTDSAHEALLFIQALYQLESTARDYEDDARAALRQDKAKPILNAFKAWLDEYSTRALPKSPLGSAVQYTLKNWTALCVYLEDGMLSIDNNAAERLMRPIAIGRKNWLFAGSDAGAKHAAICYSLIETCKLNKLNPYHYLRDVMARLPTQLYSRIHELLPWNWQPAFPLPTALPY